MEIKLLFIKRPKNCFHPWHLSDIYVLSFNLDGSKRQNWTAFPSHLSDIYVLSSPNHWFDLLQSLKICPDSKWFLQLRTYAEIVVCVGLKILILRTLQKLRLNWSISLFELIFLSRSRFEIFHQSLVGNYQTSIRGWFGKFLFYPCIEILADRNCQTCYHLWCIYITELMFLYEFWRPQL